MKGQIIVAGTLLFFTSLALAQELVLEPTQNPDAPYRLFNTESSHTFLRLDTRDGRIWQLFWRDIDSNEIDPVNSEALVTDGRVGRFTLYPTTSTYDFILLDQETGDAWHVRWGAALDRFVVRID